MTIDGLGIVFLGSYCAQSGSHSFLLLGNGGGGGGSITWSGQGDIDCVKMQSYAEGLG